MYDLKAKEVPISGAGALAGAIGYSILTLAPALSTWGMSMIFGGAMVIIYDLATTSKFDKMWRNCDLMIGKAYPILQSKSRTETSTIYKFSMPCGLSTEDIEKKQLAIEQWLGHPIKIKYVYKQIWIEVYEEKQIKISEYEPEELKGNVPILFGFSRNGKLIYNDLSTGQPHLLVAGESGSGKSTAIRSIITNLLLTTDVKLNLIDLKMGAEFNIFKNCKNVEAFARTKNEAYNLLQHISNEVDRRYDMFFENDVVDIKEYNKTHNKLDYMVIIIDEFADLMEEKDTTRLLEGISAKARACGIHLVIATQRPDCKVLNGRIKANVTTVLGLKTKDSVNSKIIFDEVGLEKLNGNGHAMLKNGYTIELQCPYLTPDRAKELIKPIEVKDKGKLLFKPLLNGNLTDFDFLGN